MGERDADLIRKLQTAHLETWIGDFEAAKEVYDGIQRQNTDLAKMLRPVVKERQVNLKEQMSGESTHVVVDTPPRNGLPETFTVDQTSASNRYVPVWKYAVAVVGTWKELIRLEVRGYNTNGELPNLQINTTNQIDRWSVLSSSRNSHEQDDDLLWMSVHCEDLANTKMFLAIDRWGLLTGNVVTPTEFFNQTVLYINSFLRNLEQRLWILS